MADVNDLLIRIDATTEQLRREMKRAESSVDRGARRINSATRRIDKGFSMLRGTAIRLAGAFGIAFGIRGLAGSIGAQLEAADQMLKLTERIGGTTEALSELQFVAERSGVQFNTLSMGLQRMVRRISEAAQGSGEAKDALIELNLNARQLAQLPLDRQFEIVADAISRVGNESDRVRLAMRLFDSEGVALLQTMQDGAAGIRELRNEARQLGITLDQDAAEGAVKANDAMLNMNRAVGSLWRDLLISLSPAIQQVSEDLREMAENMGLFDQPEIERLENEATRIRNFIQRIETNAKGGLIDTDVAINQIRPLMAELSTLEARMGGIRRLEGVRETMRETDQLIADIARSSKSASTGVQGMTSSLRTLPELAGIEGIRKTVEETEQMLAELQHKTDEQGSNIGRSLGMSLQSAVDDAILGVETSFEDMLKRLAVRAATSQIFKQLATIGGGGAGTVGGFFGNFLGFAQGGSFEVGGKAGVDQNLVAFRASRGEQVTVTPQGKQGGGAVSVVQHLHFDVGLESVDQRIAQAAGPISSATMEAVRRAYSRPSMA